MSYSIFSEKSDCNDMIDYEKGEITSPNYPFNYGPDLECALIIDAPMNHVIVTTIIDFDVSK